MNIEDCRWLTTTRASTYIKRFEEAAASGAKVSFRRELGAGRAGQIATQAELRARGASKFGPLAASMLFTRKLLEQATSLAVARYKLARYPMAPMMDICCGIGGDLLTMPHGIGVDLDPVAAEFAKFNAQLLNAAASSQTLDAADADVAAVAAWHIDPDRRSGGARVSQLEFSTPGLDTLQTLLRMNPNAALKLAPASALPDGWEEISEREWIGHRRECKQQMIWRGSLMQSPGLRRATIVGDTIRSICGLPEPLPATHTDHQSAADQTVADYIYEPHACVLAAGLAHLLASQHQLKPLTTGGGYLTGGAAAADSALAAFQVTDVLPFDVKKLRSYLRERDIGEIEIKKRIAQVSPGKLRQQLKLNGNHRAVLLIFPLGKKTRVAVAQRCS